MNDEIQQQITLAEAILAKLNAALNEAIEARAQLNKDILILQTEIIRMEKGE